MRVRESAINPLIAHAETKSTISYFIKQLIVFLTEFVHFNPIHIHGKKFNMYRGIIIVHGGPLFMALWVTLSINLHPHEPIHNYLLIKIY